MAAAARAEYGFESLSDSYNRPKDGSRTGVIRSENNKTYRSPSAEKVPMYGCTSFALFLGVYMHNTRLWVVYQQAEINATASCVYLYGAKQELIRIPPKSPQSK